MEDFGGFDLQDWANDNAGYVNFVGHLAAAARRKEAKALIEQQIQQLQKLQQAVQPQHQPAPVQPVARPFVPPPEDPGAAYERRLNVVMGTLHSDPVTSYCKLLSIRQELKKDGRCLTALWKANQLIGWADEKLDERVKTAAMEMLEAQKPASPQPTTVQLPDARQEAERLATLACILSMVPLANVVGFVFARRVRASHWHLLSQPNRDNVTLAFVLNAIWLGVFLLVTVAVLYRVVGL